MASRKAFMKAGLPLVGMLVGGSVLLSVVRPPQLCELCFARL